MGGGRSLIIYSHSRPRIGLDQGSIACREDPDYTGSSCLSLVSLPYLSLANWSLNSITILYQDLLEWNWNDLEQNDHHNSTGRFDRILLSRYNLFVFCFSIVDFIWLIVSHLNIGIWNGKKNLFPIVKNKQKVVEEINQI